MPLSSQATQLITHLDVAARLNANVIAELTAASKDTTALSALASAITTALTAVKGA